MNNIIDINGNGKLILIAPHTIYLIRNIDVHLPELYTKQIINKIRKKIGNHIATSISWYDNPDINDIKYHDPNYLCISKYKDNIWTKKIKSLKKKNTFIFDFHGMKNKYGYDIIFGFEALKKHYNKTKVNYFIITLLDIFEKYSFKYNLKIGYNILFTGYINENILTISHNAILHKIPAIQIELSKKFRENLIKNSILLNDFSKCILSFYNEIH